ncbi:LOG family protein [Acinetobacter seifertii]|uniref:LOG family protein n=1 Tax=Acinetobacter seifertii TaxID=1530123 RepID=UPI0019086869|nr:TIGR00730 family Rossman fold protein [Acinetobacter seifertii]MBJ9425111.1 TIGR00730 family Rossman fold protein [Acinetobacter seifertii]
MNSVLTMAVNDSPITSVKTTKPLIALYCGSRAGNKPIYREKAIELASGIAEQGFGLVYGGASIGLMGQVAESVLAHGGEAVGVIPEFMLDYEVAHAGLTELHVVETMHERKAMMAERASAFIALPGGLGTFEEILEIATWGQLNQHQKPMILYNVNGFYNPLIAQLDQAVQEGFLPLQHRAKLIVCEEIDQIYNVIRNLKMPKRFVV